MPLVDPLTTNMGLPLGLLEASMNLEKHGIGLYYYVLQEIHNMIFII